MCAARPVLPVAAAEADALFAGLAETSALVIAVSGGPDSTALLFLAARWRARLVRGPKLIAVTVDHALRPESAAEARAAAAVAKTFGVAHRTVRWSGRKPATGLPAAARAARYRLLSAQAAKAGARHVLTAHTLDDQAETVLLRLSRGSGIAGLAAMARETTLSGVTVVRPLLDIAKARLIATLRHEKLPFADDPSNRDPRYARSRMRTLMPVLVREGITAERLAQLARRVRRVEAALDRAVADAAHALSVAPWQPGQRIVLDACGFLDLPEEVRLRLLGRAVAQTGGEGPVELAKLESLHAVLTAHLQSGLPVRRTLAGASIAFAKAGVVIEPAPPRRGRILALTKGQYAPLRPRGRG